MSRNISILHKVKHILDSYYLYALYCTLVLPYITYSCEIWGGTYETSLANVIRLQKKAIRMIDNVPFREHTAPLFKKYKTLKFQDIVSLKTLCLIYAAQRELLPEEIQTLFTNTDSIHKYNTRASSKGNFHTKYCRTKLKSMCISVQGVKLWNNLDVNIRNLNTLSSFKVTLKQHYINKYK